MKQALPKPTRPAFADFQAPERPQQAVLDRGQFAGLPAAVAFDRIEASLKAKQDFAAITLRQKGMVLRKVLRDFEGRGLDLATIGPGDMATYREYLHDLVGRKLISEDYAAHIVNQWNSMVRSVFGEQARAGEGLTMRGFRQRPKNVEHINEAEFGALLTAARAKFFKSEHYRQAFCVYLEVAWSTGPRIGSLLNGRLRVGDFDEAKGTLRFAHMKNVPEHTAILTDRAKECLRQWIKALQQTPTWRGLETPIFIGPQGQELTAQWVNETLKLCAAAAGITKPLSTHKLRKAVGTIIGRENPKLGAEQLGITAKVYNAHYNLPTLEDRLQRRDLLPGSGPQPKSAEILGKAYVDYQSGRISRPEYDAIRQAVRNLDANQQQRLNDSPSYA